MTIKGSAGNGVSLRDGATFTKTSRDLTVTGSARSAIGSAHAVGNTASYYASRPGE